MKRLAGLVILTTAWTFPVLAGNELNPRDLTPVTSLVTPAHPPVSLVSDGRASAVVYVADPKGRKMPDPKKRGEVQPVLKRLVDELVEVVRLSTGATLELADQPPAPDRPALVIGDCEETRKAGIDAAKLPIEGFVVKTAPNRVYLVGSTQPLPPGSNRWAQWENDGTAWAVADFLERFVGVRWFWPTEVGGLTTTSATTLLIPPAHYQDQPVFRQREYEPLHGWRLPSTARSGDKEPLAFAPGVIPEGVSVINMVTYLPLVRGGNSWPYKIKVHNPQQIWKNQKLVDTHPELFKLKQDGTRHYSQLCYGNPNTLAFLLAGCDAVWGNNKDAMAPWCNQYVSWVTSTCVTLSPFDLPLDCCCENCSKFDDPKNGNRSKPSMLLGVFLQKFAGEVKKRWPDKRVIYLPYWNYDQCRKELTYPDNVLFMSSQTTYPMALNAQKENFDEAIQRLRDFRAQACDLVTIWDYCIAWSYGPHQYPHLLRKYHQAIRGISAGTFLNGMTLGEWTTTAPTMYVWMRCLWNPDIDVDAVMDEMCKRLYGKAADTTLQLMKLECDVWEKGAWTKDRIYQPGGWPVPRRLFPVVFTPDVVKRLEALHNKALAELADDPVARQRFLYWNWTFDAFLKDAAAISK
jgi:hypothetical protein